MGICQRVELIVGVVSTALSSTDCSISSAGARTRPFVGEAGVREGKLVASGSEAVVAVDSHGPSSTGRKYQLTPSVNCNSNKVPGVQHRRIG